MSRCVVCARRSRRSALRPHTHKHKHTHARTHARCLCISTNGWHEQMKSLQNEAVTSSRITNSRTEAPYWSRGGHSDGWSWQSCFHDCQPRPTLNATTNADTSRVLCPLTHPFTPAVVRRTLRSCCGGDCDLRAGVIALLFPSERQWPDRRRQWRLSLPVQQQSFPSFYAHRPGLHSLSRAACNLLFVLFSPSNDEDCSDGSGFAPNEMQ